MFAIFMIGVVAIAVLYFLSLKDLNQQHFNEMRTLMQKIIELETKRTNSQKATQELDSKYESALKHADKRVIDSRVNDSKLKDSGLATNRQAETISIRDIHASGGSLVILEQKGELHIHHHKLNQANKKIKKPPSPFDKRLLVDLQKRHVLYRGTKLKLLKPRDFICLAVLAQHPGVALSVKTIYKQACLQGIDAEQFDAETINLPKPKAIRFAIRQAILHSLKNNQNLKDAAQQKQESMAILDSRRDGTITLQIPADKVQVIGLSE